MKKMMRMFTSHDDNYKMQMFLEKVDENDALKAEEYKNRSAYVSPSTLRLGQSINKGKAFYKPEFKDYSPA